MAGGIAPLPLFIRLPLRRFIGNSQRAWGGGIMLTAERQTKEVPNGFLPHALQLYP